MLRGRSALVRVVPHSDLPALPELQALWERTPARGDEADRQAHQQDLRQAETTLSAYRAALHRQLQTATDELVARYHDDPGSCLSALPAPRQPAHRSHPPDEK